MSFTSLTLQNQEKNKKKKNSRRDQQKKTILEKKNRHILRLKLREEVIIEDNMREELI